MNRKIFFTMVLICTFYVLPSYTNTCARPDAAFMKMEEAVTSEPAELQPDRKQTRLELDVFPLQLINIQL